MIEHEFLIANGFLLESESDNEIRYEKQNEIIIYHKDLNKYKLENLETLVNSKVVLIVYRLAHEYELFKLNKIKLDNRSEIINKILNGT